jgi:hypothetical protein
VDVTDDDTTLLHRLIGGHPAAPADILRLAADTTSTPLLVAAALLASDLEFLARAAKHATTSRDRQLVALADAHLRGNPDLLDALVRDHLSEHPDNVLAAWIAAGAVTQHDITVAAPVATDSAKSPNAGTTPAFTSKESS